MRKSPTSQTEKALVAYLSANAADTSIETVTVYAGGLVDVPSIVAPPSVVCTASNAVQLNSDCGIYDLKLTVCLSTQVDDEMNEDEQDIHRERLEDLRDLLEDIPLIKSFVNPPELGTDTRTVQNYTLSCIVFEDDPTTYADRKIKTDVSYFVTASPSDSPQ